jgi:hypothetical protein
MCDSSLFIFFNFIVFKNCLFWNFRTRLKRQLEPKRRLWSECGEQLKAAQSTDPERTHPRRRA